MNVVSMNEEMWKKEREDRHQSLVGIFIFGGIHMSAITCQQLYSM